jgi:hypothetical protein
LEEEPAAPELLCRARELGRGLMDAAAPRRLAILELQLCFATCAVAINSLDFSTTIAPATWMTPAALCATGFFRQPDR